MTWAIPPGTPWVVDQDVVWVLNVRTAQTYGLEGVAALIWEATESADGLDDLVGGLVERHGWLAEDIRDDVAAFVADLVMRGVLQENAQ